MTNPQFVEHIGVVDRDVGDDNIRHQELLKHVGPDVPSLEEWHGRAALNVARRKGWHDQVLLYILEVDAFFRAKGANDESPGHRLASSSYRKEPKWSVLM